MRFDYEKAFGKPVRVVNDAAMQALGSYQGGRMLFLGLGTGPRLRARGRRRARARWSSPTCPTARTAPTRTTSACAATSAWAARSGSDHVEKVVELLKHGLQADYVMLGGGQTKKLKGLPPGVRLGNNAHAILGRHPALGDDVSEATTAADAAGRVRAASASPPRPEPSTSTRLYLVRHGATQLTAEDRFAGAVGVDLSDEGRWQVRPPGRAPAPTTPITRRLLQPARPHGGDGRDPGQAARPRRPSAATACARSATGAGRA